MGKTDRTTEVLEETRRAGLETFGRGPGRLPERPLPLPSCCAARRSGGFDDFACADARGTHAQGFAGAVDNRMNALEIGVPPSPGDVVSVAHVVSVRRAFAANFAFTRHQKLL
jgi:hypothetical protein